MSLTALEIFSVLMRKIKQVLSTNKKVLRLCLG